MIKALDHVVLTTNDLDSCVAFYIDVLGMELNTFGDNRKALSFGEQKINLHVAGSEFKPHATHPVPGSQDWCFISDVPVQEWLVQFEQHGIALLDGPVARTGATGPITSVYVNDPDGNLIEIANYD